MAREAITELEGMAGGKYLRIYLKRIMTADSAFPFMAGQKVRTQLVETTGGKEILAIVPETLEVDEDRTLLELRRSTSEVQLGLDLEADGDGGIP